VPKTRNAFLDLRQAPLYLPFREVMSREFTALKPTDGLPKRVAVRARA
jgi:hypothetical protein